MLKRQTAKGSDQVKVTFIIPHDPNQERVFVAGDFNDWNPSDLLLIKRKQQHAQRIRDARRRQTLCLPLLHRGRPVVQRRRR